MVILAVTGTGPILFAIKAGISPVPFAGRPMDGILFVQVNVVPLNVGINVTPFVVSLLHTIWLAGSTARSGDGFTVIVNVLGVPVQVRRVGVTVMVAVTGMIPVLTGKKERIFPVPLAGIPIEGLLFVQLNATVPGVPVKVMSVLAV
jgi:hypothetical protein